MRDHDTTKRQRDGEGFRPRGEQATRLETFVDAAFAFTLTLLVISCARISGRWRRRLLASVVP